MPNAITGLLADPRGEMRASPRNRLLGLLADALSGANEYAQKPDPTMPGGKANPVLGLLADAASLNSLATTAQRASYGEPLTNGMRGSKAFLKPETADVAMMAPISPRNALAALGMVGGVADNGALRAATVWHGSPHKFDKFDASKIGTGEGAQAYGRGLYFSTDPAYAEKYRNVTAETYKSLLQHRDAELAKSAPDMSFVESVNQRLAQIEAAGGNRDVAGHLYKVDMPDDMIAQMAAWPRDNQTAPGLKLPGGDFVVKPGFEGRLKILGRKD